MRRKIFLYIFLTGLLVLTVTNSIFFTYQYQQTREETYRVLQQEAIYVERALMLDGEDYFETLENINRITWINSNGEVLYDNLYKLPIANQLDYEEVNKAIASGEGRSIRRSQTGGVTTMYYAKLCSDGTILRLSRPMSAVQSALYAISPAIFVFLGMLLISSLLSLIFARQIVKPINDLDLDAPDAGSYSELEPLITRMSEQKKTITSQIDELYTKQKEFSALTDNMVEGFILTDINGTVISANYSALSLITGMEIGKNLFPYLSEPLVNCVKDALNNKRSEAMIDFDDHNWAMITNPVIAHNEITGVVIIMFDVTEREQRERLRREFTANVSHELKTPLTSISGFAELMASGIVEDDKIREFSQDIYSESQRMIALVNNIITLSELDEDNVTYAYTDVDLYDLCYDIIDSLESQCAQNDITIHLTGDHCTIKGVLLILDEMIVNLCENAIKYNVPHGEVLLSVTENNDTVVVTVTDTGIGIPYSHQPFVFERFYRVDKSRSNPVGGTGLGLSIVKHGAMLHKAQVSLMSVPDKGTTVTLTFPKNS